MEQHPVPQNVTSFEFRLIGDMTLKQFGFLAGGAILGYIFWQLPLPSIIRMPFAIIIFGSGAAFAFLPFEDRPLHRWFFAFIKSVYSPTQYIFKKSGVIPIYLTPNFPAAVRGASPIFQLAESRRKLDDYLKTLPQSLPTSLDKQESESLRRVNALLGTIIAMPTPHPTPGLSHLTPAPSATSLKIKLSRKTAATAPVEGKPQPITGRKMAFDEGGKLLFEEEKKNIPVVPFEPGKIASRADLLVEEIKKLKQAITALHQAPPTSGAPSKDVVNYQDQLSSLERQLEQAEKEKESLMMTLLRLQKNMAQRPRGVTPEEVLEKTQGVKIVSAGAAKEIGLPTLTTTPNVVTGIVQKKGGPVSPSASNRPSRDGSQGGTFLSNILVEVKDAKGNSVRAFKTNKLGQFASATPLENGTYTLELEDPQHEFIFDIIEVKVDGKVLPPLAIYARGQEEINRERIHTSLFGGN